MKPKKNRKPEKKEITSTYNGEDNFMYSVDFLINNCVFFFRERSKKNKLRPVDATKLEPNNLIELLIDTNEISEIWRITTNNIKINIALTNPFSVKNLLID